MSDSYIAIDLGATSGRVILGTISDQDITLETIHRFPNVFRQKDGHDRWDLNGLWAEILKGLGIVGQRCADGKINLRSIGADSWGVDFGLFDKSGKILGDPVAYRDNRTQGMMEKVFQIIPSGELYHITGIQFMPFNTIFQLYAQVKSGEWPERADRLLMVPDIIHYFLCGEMAGEYTNASTTQLLNVSTKEWEKTLSCKLGIKHDMLPRICSAGNILGVVKEVVRDETKLPSIPVVQPATHDTGSAVVGTPLNEGWAFISSGTWSLIGIESSEPFTGPKPFQLNFTNEGGAYGTIRFLKNVTGLWILESCRKEWQAQGDCLEYGELVRQMSLLPFLPAYLNPDHPSFLNPPSMVETIREFLVRTGQRAQWNQVELSAIILQSLALKYAGVIREIEEITGSPVKGVHIVGGGSQNAFLNQLTADACGLNVLAGPAEATALGNVLVQAIADGRFKDISEARSFVRGSLSLISYSPRDRKPYPGRIAEFKRIALIG